MGTIRVATTIRAPAARCFDLARSVAAHLSSMQTTHERGLMSKVTQFDPPRSFEDEQIAGPFQSFWHRHEFSTKDGVTVMIDLVRYRSPFGRLGTLAERVFLDRYARALLERRAAHLRTLAESGA